MSDELRVALQVVEDLQAFRQVQAEIQALSPQGLLGAADIPLWAEAQERIVALQEELRGLVS